MAFLAYYIFAYPLSLLPLRMIYGISDLFYWVMRYMYPYRKKVILQNLRNSFPERTEEERIKMMHTFYRHFSDLLAEGIKNLSISEKELRKRMKIQNPELIQKLFDEKRNVILVSGHYNNWEWLITSQNFLIPHQAVGIGMPLTSKFWDRKLNERRARFGMIIINSKTVRNFFNQTHPKPIATLLLGDQSPGDSTKAYWMKFLNQETAVQFGCEMLAHKHNQAVVFFITRKIKRGYYEIELQLITDCPATMSWGEITEKQTRFLEQEILRAPENWIWSHKRWKRDVPENLDELKKQQQQEFIKRYGSH